MIDHLWQSTLFALVIVAMVPLFARQSAGVRYWLWFAASAKFLVPISLLIRLGGYLPALPAPAKIFIAPTSITFAAPALFAPPAQVWAGAEIVVGLWALGALWIACLWLWRWQNLLAALKHADDLHLATPVPVKLVASFIEPGLIGIFHPVILMPRGVAEKLSPCEMRAVLAHELAHYRRSDNLLAFVQLLVEILFWFHPLVWWIGARLVSERERACDEAVLESGNTPRAYAEGILKICRFNLQRGPSCTAGVAGGDLKSRVQAIMANEVRHALDGQRVLLLGVLGLVTITLPLLAGAPGSAPVNRLAHQMALVLTMPALPELDSVSLARPSAKRAPHHRRALVAPAKAQVAAVVEAVPQESAPTDAVLLAATVAPILAAPLEEKPPPATGIENPTTVAVVQAVPLMSPAKDSIVCRKPQPLSGSRLQGPAVCLSSGHWAELVAQGRDVSANGRDLVLSATTFEKNQTIRPPPCISTGSGGTSTGFQNLPRATCF